MSTTHEGLGRRVARRARRFAVGCADLRERFFGHTPHPDPPGRVVFVCRGNICRSPFAAARFHGIRPDVEVVSAGVHVNISHPPPPAAIAAAAGFEVDVSAHRSRSIHTIEDDSRTLYLVFEPWQAREPTLVGPARSGRVFNLASWVDPRRSTIPDPYGGDAERFRVCFALIDGALNRLVAAWEPSR